MTHLMSDAPAERHEADAVGDTLTHVALRAEQVVGWSTRSGARALGLDHVVASIEPGKTADLVLIKNDRTPAMFPTLQPYGHVVFQAQRGDVHIVPVNGKVLKYDGAMVGIDLAAARCSVEATVEHPRAGLGEEAWRGGMSPGVPESKVLDNPYAYTDCADASTHLHPTV
jgi:5-methylthioadenosine/S-adenosylhomocysteine deaminase